MRAMKGIDLKEQMGIPVFVPARSTAHHRAWEKPNQVVVTVQEPPNQGDYLNFLRSKHVLRNR